MKKPMIAAVLAVCASTLAAAQSNPAGKDTYRWPAELVSFDAGTNTVTVKARLTNEAVAGEVKRFKPGDRVLLTWSGYDTFGDAIRAISAYSAEPKADARFLLPVELVSNEVANQYITFKVQVPKGSSSVQLPKPGEWITATSPHRPSRDAAAVVSVMPWSQTGAGA